VASLQATTKEFEKKLHMLMAGFLHRETIYIIIWQTYKTCWILPLPIFLEWEAPEWKNDFRKKDKKNC